MKTNETTPISQGYKMTSLGVIPQDWEVKRLKNISRVVTGNTPSTSDMANYGNEYFFVSPVDLSENKYIYNTEKKLSLKGYSLSRQIPAGAVLFTCIGSTIGKMGITISPLACNQQINAIICNSDISNEYVYYELSNRAKRIKLLAGEQAVPIINKSDFENSKILLPPLSEQQKIAEVLGTWDKAIEKQTQLIKKLELRKKGLMQQLLTGKKRLPGFSGEWRRVKMGEIASLYQPQTIQSEDLLSTGFPVYGANGLIGYYKKFNHELPQVVITCRGSSCGTVNYTPEKCWITGNAMVLNVDNNQNINKTFFYYLISNSSFAHLISGSGQPQIVRQPLLKFELLIPTFKEQTAIAQVLTTADREIELAQQKFELLRQQKRGLMQQLLTGKKRVKY